MKRELTLLIIIILTSYSMYGQMCGTTSVGAVSYSRKTATNTSFLNSSNPIYINIFFHVVRKSNGTGGFDTNSLDNVTNKLNAAFNRHNLYFNKLGFDHINNSTYYNIDDTGNSNREFDALVQIKNRPDAINIYIVNNAVKYIGRANGILSQALVIEKNYANTQVVSHEVGHCLNLLHTHDTMKGIEEISRSNCTIAGDLICDTPADPRLSTRNVSTSCVYTGGRGYNPLTNNIMSYSRVSCLTNFTQGQANRIRRALASSSLLQKVIVPELSSIYNNLCFSSSKTLTISNINSNTTTWQASNTISILSSNNTSITVRALNSSSTGSGWVKATLSNGTVLKEEFDVGVPYGYSNKIILVNREYNLRHTSYLYLRNWTRVFISDYDGRLSAEGSNWEWSVPNSMVRENFGLSDIDVEPSSLGQITIKARRKNECGCGLWISKVFNVIERLSGSYTLEDIN